MPAKKNQTNSLKWVGELLQLGETIDPETDRPILSYPKVRDIKYNNIGVTATDKFTTQDQNEVVKKIECRIDRSIEDNQKEYRIRIKGKIYNIERIYTKENERMMEVSLSYAD